MVNVVRGEQSFFDAATLNFWIPDLRFACPG